MEATRNKAHHNSVQWLPGQLVVPMCLTTLCVPAVPSMCKMNSSSANSTPVGVGKSWKNLKDLEKFFELVMLINTSNDSADR